MRLPAGNPRSTGWHATGAGGPDWGNPPSGPIVRRRRLSHATPLTEDSLLAIAFSGDETRLAVAYGYAAEVWDLTQTDPPQHVAARDLRRGWIDAVALSPDNRWLATGSGEAEIKLSDVTPAGRPPMVLKGHNAAVRALSFSDDGKWLASGSD